jgi:predicted O-methyltransferase YrrM
MRSFDDTWTAVTSVEGWMTREQGEALYDAARSCPHGGRIVEIGSFRGRSTIVLASAAPDTVTVFAIDPHAGNDRGPGEISGYADAAADDHAIFLANLGRAGVSNQVTHLRMFSDTALAEIDGPVDALYVDGAHRYSPARADIRDWGRRVAPGGTLLIHDAFSSVGVTLAILRELLFGRRFRYVGRAGSLAIYRADLHGGRARNAARQLAQLPWFARNLALKVALKLGLGKALRRLGREVPEWPY